MHGKKRRALQIENTACAKGQGWETQECVPKNWTRRQAGLGLDRALPLLSVTLASPISTKL